jgi:hypothetical protein
VLLVAVVAGNIGNASHHLQSILKGNEMSKAKKSNEQGHQMIHIFERETKLHLNLGVYVQDIERQ